MAETVGIVIVNWNGLEDTRACLRSVDALEHGPAFHVVVVDNGSSDGSFVALRREFPSATVLESGANLGYAGAANIGIGEARAAGARYIWLLNNDTTLDPRSLSALLAADHAIAGPAILTPKILDPQGRIWSAGGSLRWPWLERSHITADADAVALRRPRRVDWASGCSLFFAAGVAAHVGPMDERYFLYLEDVDWCLRARRRGVAIWYVPDALISHGVSRSIGAADPRLLRYYACRNYYLLVAGHGAIAGRVWAAGRLAITLAKVGLRLLTSPEHRRDPLYAAQTRALLDVLRRRTGQAPYPHERIAAAPEGALQEAR